MRTFLVCLTVLGLSGGLAAGKVAWADEHHGQAVAKPHEGRTADHTAGDPNYRWHNGHWWYWQNDRYLLWDGSRWGTREEYVQRMPRRAFSYMEEPAATVVPGQVAAPSITNERIIPSFGIRSAGSKVRGNY